MRKGCRRFESNRTKSIQQTVTSIQIYINTAKNRDGTTMQVSTLQNEQTKPANQVHVYVRDFNKLNGSSLSPKQFSSQTTKRKTVSQEIYSRSQQIKSGNQTRQGLQSQLNHKDYLQHLHPFSQSVSQDSSVSMPWLTPSSSKSGYNIADFTISSRG